METNTTLDQLVESMIDSKLHDIECRLMEKISGVKDETVGIERAIEITNLKKSTIYNLKNQNKIPCHKNGKRLLFSTRELNEWIKNGKVNQ